MEEDDREEEIDGQQELTEDDKAPTDMSLLPPGNVIVIFVIHNIF